MNRSPVENRPVFLAAFCYGALLLSTGAVAASSLRLFEGQFWPLAVSVLALSAVAGLICAWRIRATRRWHAVLDFYAERELAREVQRRAAAHASYAQSA